MPLVNGPFCEKHGLWGGIAATPQSAASSDTDMIGVARASAKVYAPNQFHMSHACNRSLVR
tara:strand:+ start:260 stop:442 length:183 start_codon:yes stop_codon:yes gene_type:complete